jgi:hypothetical protein
MNFLKQLVYYAYELKMSFQPMDLKILKIQQHDSLKHSYKNISSSLLIENIDFSCIPFNGHFFKYLILAKLSQINMMFHKVFF